MSLTRGSLGISWVWSMVHLPHNHLRPPQYQHQHKHPPACVSGTVGGLPSSITAAAFAHHRGQLGHLLGLVLYQLPSRCNVAQSPARCSRPPPSHHTHRNSPVSVSGTMGGLPSSFTGGSLGTSWVWSGADRSSWELGANSLAL